MFRSLRYPLVSVSISISVWVCALALSCSSALVRATETIDFEVIVPAGSYVVSPALPISDAAFRLQNGMQHGSNQIAHYAGWQYGQQQITELVVGGSRYRLISNAGADLTPAPLQFPLVSNAAGSTWQTSAIAAVTGVSEPVMITINNDSNRQ
jgi:hypothetical protein